MLAQRPQPPMHAVEGDALPVVQLQGPGVTLGNWATDEQKDELARRLAALHRGGNLRHRIFDCEAAIAALGCAAHDFHGEMHMETLPKQAPSRGVCCAAAIFALINNKQTETFLIASLEIGRSVVSLR